VGWLVLGMLVVLVVQLLLLLLLGLCAQVSHHLLSQCGLSIGVSCGCRGSSGWWLRLCSHGACGCAVLLVLVHLLLLLLLLLALCVFWCVQGHACHSSCDPRVACLCLHPEPLLTGEGEGPQQHLAAGYTALSSCVAHGLVQVGSDPVCVWRAGGDDSSGMVDVGVQSWQVADSGLACVHGCWLPSST
jgi:hypothetical protein